VPGDYRVRCNTRGIVIEPKIFSVIGTPQPNRQLMQLARKIGIYDATAKSIQFLEFDYYPPPFENRRYFASISGAPRYIGVEVRIDVKASDKSRPFVYTCNYFTDRGRVIGSSSLNVEIPPGATDRHMVVSWGNRAGSFWQTGTYYAECDADGVFLAGRFFEVERR
jgi:hypothetical protein